jgi:branched-chain amino acid transport system substrate-binding protein
MIYPSRLQKMSKSERRSGKNSKIKGGQPKMKKLVSMILCFAMVLSIAACGGSGGTAGSGTPSPSTGSSPSSDGTETIKIGVLTPLTGASAQLGGQTVEVYQMLVDIINEEHPELAVAMAASAGITSMNGTKIELVVADHKSDATTAVSEAKRLITEKNVVAICGEFTSALAKAVAVVTEQYQIPLVVSCSSVSLTDGTNDFEWLIRYAINDDTYVKDTFDFINYLNETQNANIKTVALFSEDSEFGANLVPVEERYAKEYGFELVEKINYSSSATNLTSEVLKLKSADPDVLIMASFVSDALLFVNTCKEQQYTPNFIIGQRGGFIQSDYLDAMGDKNNYICTTGSWAADINTEVTRQMNELWANSEYNSGKIDLLDSHVKDAINLLFLAMALEKAGTTESEALRDALLHPDYDMDTLIIPWAGIEFNEYGQNTLSNGVVTQWYDGAYHTVYPASAAAMEAVFPLPEWEY